MYEICELIRYGDDKRQLALEQLFAKAGVKTCSQAVSASKSTTSRSYLHSCGQSSSLQTILLPVPCDEKTLQQAYEEAPAGSLILGGNLPAAFVKCCQERGLHIYDYGMLLQPLKVPSAKQFDTLPITCISTPVLSWVTDAAERCWQIV